MQEFISRAKEIDLLYNSIKNGKSFILSAPAGYGKTHILRHLQERLRKEAGTTTLFGTFWEVLSAEDVARAVAQAFGKYLKDVSATSQGGSQMPAFGPWRFDSEIDPLLGPSIRPEAPGLTGLPLLAATLKALVEFAKERGKVFFVFDDFESILNIEKAKDALHLIAQAMSDAGNHAVFCFTSRKELSFPDISLSKVVLGSLSLDDAVQYATDLFVSDGVTCPSNIAHEIGEAAKSVPLHIKGLVEHILKSRSESITMADFREGLRLYLSEGHAGMLYRQIISSLAPQQRRLLSAIAKEPTAQPFTASYIERNGLGSIGGVQGALKKLRTLGYVDKDAKGSYTVTDPMLPLFLRSIGD